MGEHLKPIRQAGAATACGGPESEMGCAGRRLRGNTDHAPEIRHGQRRAPLQALSLRRSGGYGSFLAPASQRDVETAFFEEIAPEKFRFRFAIKQFGQVRDSRNLEAVARLVTLKGTRREFLSEIH
jgi:hypothetical protein